MTTRMVAAGGPRMGVGPTLRRIGSGLAPFVVMAILWQIGSLFFPKYLFPSLIDVFWRTIAIFSSWSQFAEVASTASRILAGMLGAFVVGIVFALLMVRS